MKVFTLALAVSALVATATAQDYPEPFSTPGVIIPDLTVEFLIEKAGGLWSQPSLIKSYHYACTDILPELEEIIPEVANASQIYEPICDKISQSVNNPEEFDATELCNNLEDIITNVADGNILGMMSRKRRQAPIPQDQPFADILQTLSNITMKLYNIDINDPSTICPNADNFLTPSLPQLILDFATELGNAYLPLGKPMCQDWNRFLTNLGVTADMPYYQLIQDGADIAGEAMGYDNRSAMCQAMLDALNVQDTNDEARKMFVRDAVKELFMFMTNSARCQLISNQVINEIIEPLVTMLDESITSFDVTDEMIHKYTGLNNVAGVCNKMAESFEDNYIEGKANINQPTIVIIAIIGAITTLLI